MLLLRKVSKEALWDCLFFPEKPGKNAFRFAKSIKGICNVTFSLVRKSNQKVPQRVRPLDSRGTVQNSERENYLLSHKLCAYREIFMKICNLVPYSSEIF